MTPTEIKRMLDDELGSAAQKFTFLDLVLSDAQNPNELADRPGVYVYWRKNQVIKVGRHLLNARKRALEHIPANTGGEMRSLAGDSDCHLLLFTLRPDDWHWAATPEMFLESKLDPSIKSGRAG